jgi:hypothetical protein
VIIFITIAHLLMVIAVCAAVITYRVVVQRHEARMKEIGYIQKMDEVRQAGKQALELLSSVPPVNLDRPRRHHRDPQPCYCMGIVPGHARGPHTYSPN